VRGPGTGRSASSPLKNGTWLGPGPIVLTECLPVPSPLAILHPLSSILYPPSSILHPPSWRCIRYIGVVHLFIARGPRRACPGGAVILHYIGCEALAHRRVYPGGGVIVH
jgi:hypothetical protein